VSVPAAKQGLLEQIAVCEGIIERLKAQDPPPAALLAAVGSVLSGFESELAALEAPKRQKSADI
jgi:hypothetical protein